MASRIFFIALSNVVVNTLPASFIRDLLIDGIIGGVGAVLVFLPQILILSIILGFMETTGYMARASFVMDKLMQGIGLQGKSFLPLLIGNACAIPSMMATRHIENKRERLTTIFIIPFMTCSARLPVYILIITAFVPNIHYLGGLINLRSLVLLSLYLIAMLFAAITAFVVHLFVKEKKFAFLSPRDATLSSSL